MANAVLTPTVATAAQPVAGKLWRKQVLPRGKSITYTDPNTGTARTLTFDDAYLQAAVQAFNDGAYDAVKFQIADAKNTHTEDPERARGTVRALELTADGLDMIVDLTADGAKLIADNPDLPVSARIAEGLARADGKTYPVAIKHVLGTLDPKVPGMSPWRAVDLTSDNVPTVDLTAEDYQEENRMSDQPTVGQKIREALGLAADASDIEVQAKLAADGVVTPTAPAGTTTTTTAVDDEAQLTAEELAALEALANEPAAVSLTADAQRQIDLANANAEQAIARAQALEQQARRSAWDAERAVLLHAGVPKALVDLAAPWCGGDTPAGFIDLANTDTTVESVRDAAATDMRKMLDAHKGFIDLAVIGESPEPDEEAAAARQAAIKAHRQAAGL